MVEEKRNIYNSLFDKATDGMLIIKDGKFIDCNESALKMMGYPSKEDMLNTHPSQLSPTVQPDGRSSFERAEENTQIVLKNGSHTFEWVHLTYDNKRIWVEVVLTDLSDEHKEDKVLFLVVWRSIEEKKKLESEKAHQLMLLSSVLHSTSDLIFYKDYKNSDGKYLGCNPAFEKFVGKDKDDIIGMYDIDLFGKEIGEFFRKKDKDVIKKQTNITNEEWVTYPDGKKELLQTLKSSLKNSEGDYIGILGVSRIITNEYENTKKVKDLYKELKESAQMLSQYVIYSKTDAKGIITDVSDAFCKISGYSKDECIGKQHNLVRHSDMPSSLFTDLWKTIKAGKIWNNEIKNRNKNGNYYWVHTHIEPQFDENRDIKGYMSVRHDITAKKDLDELNEKLIESKEHFKALSKKHEALANTDPLTGVMNRRALFEYASAYYNKSLNSAVLMLDIDNFKKINDTYGHDVGDLVLQSIANTCKDNLRQDEIFSRLGGEEFVIFLNDTNKEKAIYIANRILREVSKEKITKQNLNVTLSIGLALNNDHKSESFSALLKEADIALYRAKQNGKNQYQIMP